MAEPAVPLQRHRHWCSSQRLRTHRIIKADTHATATCVRLMDVPLLVTVTISKGIMMTERFTWTANLSFSNHHQYGAVTSPGCLIMVAPTKAAISQIVYCKTGCSVKDWGWGWPHMLRLHAAAGVTMYRSWRDGDVMLPWGNNPVFISFLNVLFSPLLLRVSSTSSVGCKA